MKSSSMSTDVIASRIDVRNKFKQDETIERRKARLVAQNFSQKPDIHFMRILTGVGVKIVHMTLAKQLPETLEYPKGVAK